FLISFFIAAIVNFNKAFVKEKVKHYKDFYRSLPVCSLPLGKGVCHHFHHFQGSPGRGVKEAVASPLGKNLSTIASPSVSCEECPPILPRLPVDDSVRSETSDKDYSLIIAASPILSNAGSQHLFVLGAIGTGGAIGGIGIGLYFILASFRKEMVDWLELHLNGPPWRRILDTIFPEPIFNLAQQLRRESTNLISNKIKKIIDGAFLSPLRISSVIPSLTRSFLKRLQKLHSFHKLIKHAQDIIEITKPGSYEVGEDGQVKKVTSSPIKDKKDWASNPRYYSYQELKKWFENNFSCFHSGDPFLPPQYRGLVNEELRLKRFFSFKSSNCFSEELQEKVINILANIPKEINIGHWAFTLYVKEDGSCKSQIFYHGKPLFFFIGYDWKIFLERVIFGSRWQGLIELQSLKPFSKVLFFTLIDDFIYRLWPWLTAPSPELRSSLFSQCPELKNFLKKYFCREFFYSPNIKEYFQKKPKIYLCQEDTKALDNLHKQGLMPKGQYLLLRYVLPYHQTIFDIENEFQKQIFYHTEEGRLYCNVSYDNLRDILIDLEDNRLIKRKSSGDYLFNKTKLKEECQSICKAKAEGKVVLLFGSKIWSDAIAPIIVKKGGYVIKTNSKDELLGLVEKDGPDLIFAQEVMPNRAESPKWMRKVREEIGSDIPIIMYSLEVLSERLEEPQLSLRDIKERDFKVEKLPGKLSGLDGDTIEEINDIYYPGFIREGNGCFKKGEYLQAIKLYKKAQAIYPERLDAWHNLALAYLMLEKYEESLSYYKKVISIMEGHYEAWWNIAEIFAKHRKKKKMLYSLFKAITLCPLLKDKAEESPVFKPYWDTEGFLCSKDRGYFNKLSMRFQGTWWITLLTENEKKTRQKKELGLVSITSSPMEHLGFRIKDSGFRIQDSGLSIQNPRLPDDSVRSFASDNYCQLIIGSSDAVIEEGSLGFTDSITSLLSDYQTSQEILFRNTGKKIFDNGDDFINRKEMYSQENDSTLGGNRITQDIAEISIAGNKDERVFVYGFVDFL
ncbi:MAG: tetratricopeptide repeat protein, partial [Bacteroidetes bacterium]|nr:tetratricopeptide repeat protein [Bacteroidota bacterium]